MYSYFLFDLRVFLQEDVIRKLSMSSSQVEKLRELLPRVVAALEGKEEMQLELPGKIFLDIGNHSKLGAFVVHIRQYCKY